jgi:(p)ppGpp synthase/HD superfamily hydrolase
MQERHISFEQLTDVMAFRVITAEHGGLLRALGIMHRRWQNGAGPLQGLYLDAQAQRLSLAAHHA